MKKKLLEDNEDNEKDNMSPQEKQILSYMISNYKIMLLDLGLRLSDGNELSNIKVGIKKALRLLNEDFWSKEIFINEKK